ncbi:MAG: thrombospondin type 3 repeat-containing protein [Myxococcota bacterium]|nr:thrombospondin type 3 repeat-containing protein [Myxococcota bacterium]
MKNKAPLVSVVVVGLAMVVSGVARAQDDAPYECDNNFDECGTPQQSGGGGGGGGGSILVNNTDLGDAYQYADDYDDDGVEDPYDNCPFISNRDQADDDADGVGNGCDNCPSQANEDQGDIDGDRIGDVCDEDMDGDGVLNGSDICPENPDPLQKDTDGDGLGDACDEDMDNDGVVNLEDNCPLVANPDQADDDPDQFGDACDDDDDGDGIRNAHDNCTQVVNPTQDDSDGDTQGDACDPDIDDDGLPNPSDNCPAVANLSQSDLDRDGLGDACDAEFCYVVMGNVQRCLNPSDIFKVYSPNMLGETGESIKLRLFANRVNQPLRYTWTITGRPAGSHATVAHPRGAATISTPFEYHYLKDRKVEFVPDKPGTYQIHVVAELVWTDEVTGEANVKGETQVQVTVEGDALSSPNCSVTAAGSSASGWYMPLLLMVFFSLAMVFARRKN